MKWNCGRRSFRHWKANIRGVDLGDQFPAHWEEERERRQIPGPAPRDYSGPAPLCEPEAAALASLAEQYPGDAAVSCTAREQKSTGTTGDMSRREAESWQQGWRRQAAIGQ